jgi:hypothetical protein
MEPENPEAAVKNYREQIKRMILVDRAACMIERYRGKDFNSKSFNERWG